MTNIKTKISDCTCRGIKLIKELSDYYIRDLDIHIKGLPRDLNRNSRESKVLVHKIHDVLTDKGVKYSYDLPPIDSLKKDVDFNRFFDGCNEHGGSDCVAALELIRSRLHHGKEIREKLLCGHRDQMLREDDIERLVGELFDGSFYDQEGKHGILYDPYNKYVRKSLRDECDRR